MKVKPTKLFQLKFLRLEEENKALFEKFNVLQSKLDHNQGVKEVVSIQLKFLSFKFTSFIFFKCLKMMRSLGGQCW